MCPFFTGCSLFTSSCNSNHPHTHRRGRQPLSSISMNEYYANFTTIKDQSRDGTTMAEPMGAGVGPGCPVSGSGLEFCCWALPCFGEGRTNMKESSISILPLFHRSPVGFSPICSFCLFFTRQNLFFTLCRTSCFLRIVYRILSPRSALCPSVAV